MYLVAFNFQPWLGLFGQAILGLQIRISILLLNSVDYNSTFPNLFATFLYMSTSCFDNGLIFFMASSKCFIFIFKSFACFSASLESGYLVICSLNANITAADDSEAISAPVYPSVLSAKSSILKSSASGFFFV